MVLGPGPMDWNIVSCNASSIPKLVDSLFFNHNDWVEPSFHNIDLGWFDFFLYYSSIDSSYWTLLLWSLDATICLSRSSFVVVSMCYRIHFSFHCFGHYGIPWCTHFLISPSPFFIHICYDNHFSLMHFVYHWYLNFLWQPRSLLFHLSSLFGFLAPIRSPSCLSHPMVLLHMFPSSSLFPPISF